MRIVHVANFYGPRSGGLRTAVDRLTAGYAAAGHEVTVVVPGPLGVPPAHRDTTTAVTRLAIAAPRMPGTGGYRLLDPGRVRRVVERLAPDHLEISDRLTLRGLGRWAAGHGVTSALVAHERVDRLLTETGCPPAAARRLADLANRRSAGSHDAVVCATRFAEEEFRRIGARNVVRVPLGVDLDTFSPDRHDAGLRQVLAQGASVLLLHCGRLSREKHPLRSIECLAALLARGVDARLLVAGDGPMLRAARRRAAGLPVEFLGFVADRRAVADLLAAADVCLSPGPHETFGLSALESLASGTPVVVSASSASAEVVGPDGRETGLGAAAEDSGAAFADAVQQLLAVDPSVRWRAARARAEQFPWSVATARMLDLAARLRVPPPSEPAAVGGVLAAGG